MVKHINYVPYKLRVKLQSEGNLRACSLICTCLIWTSETSIYQWLQIYGDLYKRFFKVHKGLFSKRKIISA
jgi:hypothetical protein